MPSFLKRDPIKKAKKHIEKALEELEDGYPDYASTQYEKAARLFLEGDNPDFAVKYFRESASCSLKHNDNGRAAMMKTAAAETLLQDGNYGNASYLFSEASDHYFKANKVKESIHSVALSILCNLAIRSYDTAIGLLNKIEERLSNSHMKSGPELSLTRAFVRILSEGEEVEFISVKKALTKTKFKDEEKPLLDFVVGCIEQALKTEVRIEWAGQDKEEVMVKAPIEFELRYQCPTPVRVIDYRFPISSSLVFTKEPNLDTGASTDESWLFELNPVLSGEGKVGPFWLTLEGDQVLVQKQSNELTFQIAQAPSDLKLDVTPRRVSCSLGEEAILTVAVSNEGSGPAGNISIFIELSSGLEISLGSDQKTIQFLGPGENIRFQVIVRGIGLGEENVKVKLVDVRQETESEKITLVTVD
jgi:tetratricopeptide (TPR) repeat protein